MHMSHLLPLGSWLGAVPPFRLGQLHLPVEMGMCIQQETSAFPSSMIGVIKIFKHLVLHLVSGSYGRTDRQEYLDQHRLWQWLLVLMVIEPSNGLCWKGP